LIRLGRSCPDLVNELRMLNQEIIRPCLPSDLILDLDSTVETVYGDQSGAAKGTNPHKPGRKSYHPLLAFEGQTRLHLNTVLRPGNTHSSTDATDFLKQTFSLIGERKVKYARFDKGFGGEDFYSLWEQKNIGYVGKLKWTQRLAKEVQACRYWTRYVDEDWIIEGISLIYKATSWNKARRVAIIRKAQVFDDGQGRIVFDIDWQYEAIVTNLEWEPIDLWRFYNQRCCMENYIKEAKNGFSIDRVARLQSVRALQTRLLRTGASGLHDCPISLRILSLRRDAHLAWPLCRTEAHERLRQPLCLETNRGPSSAVRMMIHHNFTWK